MKYHTVSKIFLAAVDVQHKILLHIQLGFVLRVNIFGVDVVSFDVTLILRQCNLSDQLMIVDSGIGLQFPLSSPSFHFILFH